MPKHLFLREQFAHMGKHSGYDCLFKELEQSLNSSSVWKINKYQFTTLQTLKHWNIPKSFKGASPFYNKNSYAAEKSLLQKARQIKPSVIHVGYLENCLWLLSQQKYKQKLGAAKFIATAHQPPSWWRINANPQLVSNLDALIVLSAESKAFFEAYLPNKVHFIPHGIDIDFFRPDHKIIKSGNRCIFLGHWLRDLSLLSKVIQLIASSNKTIHFDIVYSKPNNNRENWDLYKMLRYPNVHWHKNLSNEQLRTLYLKADLLLLPLIDCTANNALLEGMACGLPVITTELKGVKSYTHETFTKYFQNYDAGGMAQAVETLLRNKELRLAMAKKARIHAVNNLSWPNIARRTKELYQAIIDA